MRWRDWRCKMGFIERLRLKEREGLLLNAKKDQQAGLRLLINPSIFTGVYQFQDNLSASLLNLFSPHISQFNIQPTRIEL